MRKFVTLLAVAVLSLVADASERMSLDGFWDFAFEEEATLAKSRTDFEATGKMVVPGCFDLMPEWYARRGLAHYRRTFSLSAPARGAWLVIKGMGLQARFFLDGREIAESKLPYSTLEIPLGALAAGEHVLVAALDNNLDGSKGLVFKPNYDFFLSGGFYHGVELSFDNRKLFVRTRDYKSGTVEIEAVNFEDRDFDATLLFDGRNEVAAKFKNGRATVKVPDFKLWSPESPSLHTVAIKPTTNHYQLTTKFGIREFAAHDKAFWLNGNKVWLKGVNRHEAHPEDGYATSLQTMLRDVRLMKSIGCNFVRGSHYPQREEFLDLCDEQGLLVWEESLGWGNNGSDLGDSDFMASQVEQTRMMVRESINHPSVVVSAFLNEFRSDTKEGLALAEKLIAAIRAEDSGHLVSYACNNPFGDICATNADFSTFNCYPAWHSEMGRGSTLGSLDAVIREQLQRRVQSLRLRYGDDRPIVVGETGCYSLYGCHDPMGAQWSEEFQSEYLDCWLRAVKESPDISGFAVWQFCDTRTYFRGGSDIRTKPLGLNMAGLFDRHRNAKLAHQAAEAAKIQGLGISNVATTCKKEKKGKIR